MRERGVRDKAISLEAMMAASKLAACEEGDRDDFNDDSAERVSPDDLSVAGFAVVVPIAEIFSRLDRDRVRQASVRHRHIAAD
jgi:hypothetical protein